MREDTVTTTPDEAAAYEASRHYDDGHRDTPDASELAAIDRDLEATRNARTAHNTRRTDATAAGRWYPTWDDTQDAALIASCVNLASLMAAGPRAIARGTVVRDGVIAVAFLPETPRETLTAAEAAIVDRSVAATFTGLTYDTSVDRAAHGVGVRANRPPAGPVDPPF